MIKLDIREEELDNPQRALQIANTIFLTKRLSFNGKTPYDEKIKKCFDFYDGRKPITTFKKNDDYISRIFNLVKPLVDTATQTFIGELPNVVTKGKKVEKDKISVFNSKLYENAFGTHINEVGHYGSKVGSGLLCLYSDLGDKFPRFKELNPLYADCVYDCSLEEKHVCSYYIVELNQPVVGGGTLAKNVLYLYTKKRLYAFESNSLVQGQATTPDTQKQPLIPFYAFSFNYNGVIEPRNYVDHDFGDIPLVEFPNNASREGDCECVFDLCSFYNDVINSRGKNLMDIVNYLLYIKNARIGDEEQRQAFIDMLEQHHVLAIEGDDVDARFLSNQLNQEQLQMLQNNVKDMIHYISRIPDLSSVDFSQNASDPIIKIKTKPLLDLCKEKEKYFTEPYIRVIKMILNWCKENDEEYENYNFETKDITLRYTHTLPSNDSDMITMVTNLVNSGLANPEVLLEELSFVPSVHEYMKGVVKFNEYVDKRKQANNNVNRQEQGLNENNLTKQNEKPLVKKQMDNRRNFNEGNADTLSIEKVEKP